jgi:hypothetical protein
MGGGIGFGSFWRPSRGPTSTIFTKLGLVELAVLSVGCEVEKDLRDALRVERRIRMYEEVADELISIIQGVEVNSGYMTFSGEPFTALIAAGC